jgi:osmotically-inducible protein OsmY
MMQNTLRTVIVIGALAGTAACAQDEPPTVIENERRPGDAAGDAAREAGSEAGAAMETADVKTALTMDTTVDASDINVDTNADTRVVVLRGSVPTTEQRDRAEAIARQQAPDYRVDNQLTVRAR